MSYATREYILNRINKKSESLLENNKIRKDISDPPVSITEFTRFDLEFYLNNYENYIEILGLINMYKDRYSNLHEIEQEHFDTITTKLNKWRDDKREDIIDITLKVAHQMKFEEDKRMFYRNYEKYITKEDSKNPGCFEILLGAVK